MTDTTQITPPAAGWADVAVTLGKYALALLLGAGGLWGVQKVTADPKPTPAAQTVHMSADELRKAVCPAPVRRAVKVEGNMFGTSAK